jgi:Dolichyl-phosphate-mannose-protein mannosyltransferase
VHRSTKVSDSLRLPRPALPLLLAAFLLLASAYSIVIPLGEAPDEVSHFAYVEYVAAHARLPPAEGAALGEVHQPPLYYLLCGLSIVWIPHQDIVVIANPDFALDNSATPNLLLHTRREAFPYHDDWLAWHLARLLSVIMGAVTVWATWQVALTIFPERQFIALGSAAFVAFLPEFVFLSGAVNNDNLIIMLSALGFLLVLRMLSYPVRVRNAAILGILLGAALITKLSGAILWVLAAGAFFWSAREHNEWKNRARDFTICFVLAGIIAAPWSIYNLHEYGDPFAWALYLQVGTIRQTPITLADWAAIARGIFTSFGGRFGGALQIHLSPIVYTVFGVVTGVASLGWIGYARDYRRGIPSGSTSIGLVAGTAFSLLIGAAYASWAIHDRGAGQVRQLFPALPLVAIFLTAGLLRLFPSKERIALVVWSGGSAAWSIVVLIYIGSVYIAPTYTPVYVSTTAITSVPADFGETIRVLNYHVGADYVAPGKMLAVDVYWQSLKATREDYWLRLQLMRGADTLAYSDGVPSAGRLTTDWWVPGQVFLSRHTLVLPADVAPGKYTLTLGLRPFPRYDWLRVGGKEFLALATIQVVPK